MSENINEIILKDETDPTDVEGHYLPLDDEGNVDFAPHQGRDRGRRGPRAGPRHRAQALTRH